MSEMETDGSPTDDPASEEAVASEDIGFMPAGRMRLLRMELKNFLSYRDAAVEFGDLTAMVGANASGKSNAVAALKLLRDIPTYGLQTALLRRGGFDQLRHRSEGRPYDPSIVVEFALEGHEEGAGRYELRFGSLAGGRYEVKLERCVLDLAEGRFAFTHRRERLEFEIDSDQAYWRELRKSHVTVPDGQSAIPVAFSYGPFYPVYELFSGLQIVEINPARVRELQDPTSITEFEPDGSNTATIFENLPMDERRQVVDELKAIVPSLDDVEVRRFSTKVTLSFIQLAAGKRRIFLANQMSDGTLRAFSIILALFQARRPYFVVVEEPEVAIHLGALRTLVEILRAHAEDAQILVTTHSADIIDALDIEELRVIWSEAGISHIGAVAEHTRETVRAGLVTPGELLRADSLDPASA